MIDYQSHQRQDLDTILDIFKDINVKNLIKEQITELKGADNLNIINNNGRILVSLEYAKSQFTCTLPQYPVLFMIKIKKGFPLTSPRVHMQTSICNPTTNDLRDFFRDIMGKEWNYSIRLKDIQQKIPSFVNKVFENKKNGLVLQKMGYFYLGQLFSYKLLKTCKGIEMFLAFSQLEEKVIMDYITVSDSHIMILRPDTQPNLQNNKLHVPQDQKIHNVKLISYADIQSVSQIKISRIQNSQLEITLQSQRLRKMSAETIQHMIHYRVVKSKELVKKLLKNIPKYQNVEMLYQTQRKDDFLEMQNSIRIAQNNLKRYFNKDNINLLNSYYQNAVQYLSGNGNPAYLVYLNKITQLSLRQDVKLVTSTQK